MTFCLLKVINLIHFLWDLVFEIRGADTQGNIIVDLVEIVHLFLIGTVLFLTSLGIYELFIQPLPLPPLLKTHNIEELELNLVGLTIVVLAVNFLSVILRKGNQPGYLRNWLCLTYHSAGLLYESAFANKGK